MFTQLSQKVYKNGKTGVKRIEKYYVNDRVGRQESLKSANLDAICGYDY